MTSCPFCGYVYDGTKAAGCNGCPLASNCAMACCPRCGYKQPTETRLGKLLRRIAPKGEANASPSHTAER